MSIGGTYAQYVKIHGLVSDSLTGEPLPFVNVVFKGKNIGTTTDIDGKYIIESEWGSNYLQSVSYTHLTLPTTPYV